MHATKRVKQTRGNRFGRTATRMNRARLEPSRTRHLCQIAASHLEWSGSKAKQSRRREISESALLLKTHSTHSSRSCACGSRSHGCSVSVRSARKLANHTSRRHDGQPAVVRSEAPTLNAVRTKLEKKSMPPSALQGKPNDRCSLAHLTATQPRTYRTSESLAPPQRLRGEIALERWQSCS